MRPIQKLFLFFLCVSYSAGVNLAYSTELITDKIIKEQIQKTKEFKLDNNIPVIYRQVEGSDILQINLLFDRGYSQLKEEEKTIFSQMMANMNTSAKGWDRNKVFEITEKYSSGVSCSAAIELSSCSMHTLNDYWPQILPLFQSILLSPSFDQKDIDLSLGRKKASLTQSIQSNQSYINDLINQIFYPKNHPYKLGFKEELSYIEKTNREKILKSHKKLIDESKKFFVVVGSLDIDQLKSKLNKAFGKIPQKNTPKKSIPEPSYDPKNNYIFEHRDITTAYLSVKMNLPSRTDEDYTKVKLLYHILDEELGEEIRTKRSLSYSVYSYYIAHSIGIGVLSASTSKPKETLDAMALVLNRLKNKKLSKEKIKEYQTVYTTSYFLNLETHSSLASSLASYRSYFDNVNGFYSASKKVQEVSPDDIQRLAKKYFVNPRIAVLFHKDQFQKKNSETFFKAMTK